MKKFSIFLVLLGLYSFDVMPTSIKDGNSTASSSLSPDNRLFSVNKGSQSPILPSTGESIAIITPKSSSEKDSNVSGKEDLSLRIVGLSITGASVPVSPCGNSISYTISNGTGPSYDVRLFTSANTFVDENPTSGATGFFSVLPNGTYYLAVKDNTTGASFTSTVLITVNNACDPQFNQALFLLLCCCKRK